MVGPQYGRHFYVSGGGWSDRILAPAGISVNALTRKPAQ